MVMEVYGICFGQTREIYQIRKGTPLHYAIQNKTKEPKILHTLIITWWLFIQKEVLSQVLCTIDDVIT